MSEIQTTSSDTGKFILEAFRPYLEKQIDSIEVCRSLSHVFYFNNIFSQEQRNRVHQEEGATGINYFFSCLYGALDHPSCYKIFCETLSDYDLQYVIDTLEGKYVEKSVCINLWENALKINFSKLILDFDPRGILTYYGTNLFDKTSLEKIKAEKTTIGRNELFFYYLTKQNEWFPKFLSALKDENCGNLMQFVSLLDPEGNGQSSYFFTLIDWLLPEMKKVLSVEDILDYMQFPEKTKEYIKSKPEEEKVETFVNILTSQDHGWFKQFVAALEKCGKYEKLLEIIDPNEGVKTKKSSNQVFQDTGGYFECASSDKVMAEPLVSSNNDSNQPLLDASLSSSSLVDKTLNITVSEKHEEEDSEKLVCEKETASLKLRDYQVELAQPALDGHNCMIVAPTGCGKTFVALKICMEHIEKNPNAKVIFLVPRVPLVKQQFNLFKTYIKDNNKLFQITGDSSSTVPVHISIQQHDLTFMTAQILVNLFNDGLMKISDISLLIFDECHHTVKNDPYNQIMGIYLDELHENKSTLPQVVGLTASPGMGKAKTMSQAHQNIKSLMANLDVTTAPVQVKKQRLNLRSFQNEAIDEVITVTRGTGNPFIDGVRKAMREIEEKIRKEVEKFENKLGGRIKFDLRATHGTQDYEAWAVTLLNKSKLVQEEEPSQYFMCCALHLKEYNSSLMLNDHVQINDAIVYLVEVLFKEKPRNEVEEEMAKVYPFLNNEPWMHKDTNPLLARLTQKLCEEFDDNDNSRCIIFVKTRTIARALLSYLSKDLTLHNYKLNPKQLTGAAARSDNFGMTKVGQDDNLTAFREGKCKVLVATSVAEEGLDIKECNLIITYNYSTNEVGKVQRRGRGRAENSKVIMLAYDDSGHVKRERENQIRERLTQDILNKLSELSPKVLEGAIRDIQKDLYKDREFEKTVKNIKAKKKKPSNNIFSLKCIWCKKPATTSDKFRHINRQHRVVVDKEFRSRALFKEVPESEAQQCGDEQWVIGKIFCRNKLCQREWGLRMRYKKFPISVLRIENFLIINDKGYRAVKKKWKDAPFTVERELTGHALQELVDGLNVDDDNNEILEDDTTLGANLQV